ncbi:MAG: sigma-70 family RNA polymerase sigma factor [Pseudomonadota bacterium]
MKVEPPPQPSRDESSPAALLAAVAARADKVAFARLYDHFGPRVLSYLRRLGSDQAIAEDLTQEVMLTVWRRAATFDPSKAAISTWIFTIARNRRIDALRKERRPELDPSDPALVGEPPEMADHKVAADEEAIQLRAVIDELPEEQAELLRLAFFQDKSHAAIAEQLALPLGTVKSRLRLAMAKLRTKMQDRP